MKALRVGQLALVVMWGVIASVAQADIVTAASGNRSDVQSALNSAVDGDIVQIPAGTWTWSQTVSLNTPKAITIQGAGIDQTVIVDNVPKAGGINAELLTINLALGKRFRLTGMTFRGMAQDTEVYNKGTIVLSGNAQDFRVDHIKIERPGTAGIRYYGWLYGVVDHCVFDMSNHQDANVVQHQDWGNRDYGDGSFSDSLHLGTDMAIYFEDNTFTGSGIAGKGTVDAWAGARVVFRHNTVTNDNFCTHGTESSGRNRGVRSYEIYDNTFTTATLMFCGIYLRGGTGVIFNNIFKPGVGETGYMNGVLCANYRCNQAYAPWGQVTGSNSWDGNQDASGYPCLDQVGRGTGDLLSGDSPTPVDWPHQASEPLYLWSNSWTQVQNNPGARVGSQHNVIQANRDWFDNTQKTGYEPYIYPHPLTQTGAIYAATSCSQADVQAALNAAKAGDMVLVPAGTATWNNGLTINKGIHLKGAGAGRVEGSSTTSLVIGTGSKSFAIQPGSIVSSGFTVGETVRAVYKSRGSNYMEGIVTSWDGVSLTLNVNATGGSGTYAAWTFVMAAKTTISTGANINLFVIHEDPAHNVELSDMRLVESADASSLVLCYPTAGGKKLLFHDIRYTITYCSPFDFRMNGGVLWRIYGDAGFNFSMGQSLGTIRIKYSGGIGGWDSVNSMGAADTYGDKHLYIESSYFCGLAATDWDDNARGVFRHNVLDNASAASHGADTSGVGGMHVEYYNNLCIFNDLGNDTINSQGFIESRGGTGIVADNVIPNISSSAWGNKAEIKLQIQVLDRNAGLFGLWGQNAAGTQYPAPRQVGMGHANSGYTNHSVAFAHPNVNLATGLDYGAFPAYLGDRCPWYQWGNTGGGNYASPSIERSGYNEGTPDNPADYIQVGRDWINGVKPGYSKYTYPHPLRGDSPAPTPLPEGNTGIAAQYPGDANIQSNANVIFADDFESYTAVNQLTTRWNNLFQVSNTRLATEAGNYYAGGKALEFKLPQTTSEVANGLQKYLNPTEDVLFVRYYTKFDAGFSVVGSGHNGASIQAKYDGPGVPANGTNKFLVMMENSRDQTTVPSPGPTHLYIYHPEQRDIWGDHWYPSGRVVPFDATPGDFGPYFVKRPEETLELGRWYCVEMMVKANTPGKRDGRIAFWIDGVLKADFLNVRLRDVATLKIDKFDVGLHARASTRENKKWYDNVVAARTYIGPLTNPTAPVIVSQPASQTVSVGQTATFGVTATGTPPLSYQWQNNMTNISAATNASYTTPATILADNGAQFRVVVTNSLGSVTSSVATLTVTGSGGPVYYVDQTAGNDANNGTSPGTPWKNCPGMAAYSGAGTLAPGATVYFDKADTWLVTGNQGIYLVGGVTYIGDVWGSGQRAEIKANADLEAGVVRFRDHATYPTVFKGFNVNANGKVATGVDFNHRYWQLMNGATKRVENCEVHHVWSRASAGQYKYGIIASNHGGAGGYCENVEIINCKVHDISRDIICVYPGDENANCRVKNVTVRGCEVYHSGQDPDYAAGSGICIKGYVVDVTVENNYVHDVDAAGVFINGNESNHFPGVGPTNVHLRYNIVGANTPHGSIRIYDGASGKDPKDVKIYGNIVYGNGAPGLYLEQDLGNANTLRVYNNTFYNAPVYIDAPSATFPIFEFKNNIVYYPGGTPITGANRFTASSNNLTTNPFFTNSSNLPTGFVGTWNVDLAPNADGLSLQATSAGVDGGAALAAEYAGSINSVLRPAGLGWDIGAYEYVEHEAAVSLSAGYTLIALPLVPTAPLTAEGLGQQINAQAQSPNCTSVIGYENGAFVTHPVGTAVNNFTIGAGKGYFVRCAAAGTWRARGCRFVASSAPVPLGTGYSLIGLPLEPAPAEKYTAEGAGQEIAAQGGGATQIIAYDAQAGQFVTHPVGTAVSNFTLQLGRGYFVRCTKDSTWIVSR